MLKKFLIAILCFWLSSIALANEVKPIHNIYLERTSLTKQEVYWIYSLRTRFWSDGTKIVVYYMDFDHPIHKAFVSEVLKTSPNSFRNSVETYVNAGNASYFRKTNSENEMYHRVSSTIGAVGYISTKTLLINDGDNRVKEIRIVD